MLLRHNTSSIRTTIKPSVEILRKEQPYPFHPHLPTLFLNKSNLDLPRRLQYDICMQPRMLATHQVLDAGKPLQQSHKRVPHLCQRKLLPDADPRAAVEGDICP